MIILTTGKGGVGKTTVAAATAAQLAQAGHHTIVVSIDPAHSLGDVLGENLNDDDIHQIDERLAAYEVRLSVELKHYWGKIQHYLVKLLSSQGVDRWLAEDMAFLPGLDEIVGLLKIAELHQKYEYVVVDCPPTGSTLRYLGLPQAIHWYMERFFPVERKLVQAIGPIAERISGIPMPKREVFDQIEHLFADVLQLREILFDPEQTLAQLVTTSESVVVKETERAWGYLAVHGVGVARVVLNKAQATVQTAQDWQARFAPVPVEFLSQQTDEPIGAQALAELAQPLVLLSELPKQVTANIKQLFEPLPGPTPNSMILMIHLPKPREKGEFKIGRRGDDLLIDWGPTRRYLPLPPMIAQRKLMKAHWDTDGLRIEFSYE